MDDTLTREHMIDEAVRAVIVEDHADADDLKLITGRAFWREALLRGGYGAYLDSMVRSIAPTVRSEFSRLVFVNG